MNELRAKARETLKVLLQAHHTDLHVRIDGQFKTMQADWLKEVLQYMLKPVDEELAIIKDQTRQAHEALEKGDARLAESCIKTAETLLDNLIQGRGEPRLVGPALQQDLMNNGVALCPTCKGTGQYYDVEDEELISCPKCEGSGRWRIALHVPH